MSEEGAERVVITVTRIDIGQEGRVPAIAGKSAPGLQLVFLLRSATQIRQLSPVETTRTLREILTSNDARLPLRLQEEVLVAWRLDPATSEKVAVKITVLQ